MPSMMIRGNRRGITASVSSGARVVAAALVLTVTVLLALVGSSTVSAHTGFESSSPANGAVVDTAVDVVTIVFTGDATPVGDRFVALNAAGELQVPTSIETTDNKVFTVRFDPPLAGGDIGVRWKVAAADTHPIEGSFSFTVNAPVPTTAPASTLPASTAAVDTAPEATEPEATAPEATVTGVGQSGDDPTSGAAGEPDVEPAGAGAVPLAAPVEAAVSTQSLDEFLAVDDATPGSSVATAGRVVGLLGVVVGLGVLALLGAALRGSRTEIRQALRSVRVLGVVVVVGAIIEYVGIGRILDRSFTSTWSVASGFAAVLRMAGGLAIAVGLTNTMAKVSPARTLSAAVVEDRGAVSSDPQVAAPLVRWVPTAASWLAGVGVAVILVSFWFDGHTVSKGWRPIHALVNSVHIAAGAVWVGGVVALAVVAWRRYRAGEDAGVVELVLRFSKIATIALGSVVVAGGMMAVLVLDSFGELTGTPWGKMLLLKTTAVALAAAGGAYNHFTLLPALEADPESPERRAILRSTLTSEAVMLLFVVAVTAWLVAAAS